jgi:hypothetical protein
MKEEADDIIRWLDKLIDELDQGRPKEKLRRAARRF